MFQESRGLLEVLYSMSHDAQPQHLLSSTPALLYSFAASAVVMEHDDSSRGSCVGTLGERGRAPSHRHCLESGAIIMSRYG
jgi:hypothetical protein